MPPAWAPAASSRALDHQAVVRSETGMPRVRQGGFTLAELIVVILIVGILAVAILPRFFQTQDYEVQGTLDRVLATVRYAQKAAIGARCNVRVTFAGNGVSAAF